MGQFDMRLLSVMFMGMQIQRTFGGMLKSVKNTFFKAEGDTSALTMKTTELTAAWEFFKFSLFDALNTDFFISLMDGLTKVINKFSQMSGTAKRTILTIIGTVASLGFVMFTFSQLKLAWDAIFSIGGLLNSKGKIAGTFTDVDDIVVTHTNRWTKWIKGALGAAFVVDASIQGYKFLTSDDFDKTAALKALRLVTEGAIGLKLLGVSTPWTIIITATALITLTGIKFMKKATDKMVQQEYKSQGIEILPEGTAGGMMMTQDDLNKAWLGEYKGQGTYIPEHVSNILNNTFIPSIGNASEKIKSDMTPSIEGLNSSIGGDLGLNMSLDNTTTKMNVMINTTTPAAIDAQNTRIENNMKEKESVDDISIALDNLRQQYEKMDSQSQGLGFGGRGQSTIFG